MPTLRFNPFGQVHKGLRALLFDTAIQLQHANFTQEAEVRNLTQRIQLVVDLFECHAHIEDSLVFPMIKAFEPEIVDDFEAQHDMDHEIAKHVSRCADQLNAALTEDEKLYAGEALLHQFNAFLAFNVEHMKKEETIVNGCLWKYYSDEDLFKNVKAIASKVPQEENQHFTEWMLRGMATHEITHWYLSLKQEAPSDVFESFCNTAQSILPHSKWASVKESL